MPADCEFVRDNIDAWALGALDGDDARSLEAHLETCADCQQLSLHAQETAAALGLGVPLVSASQTLRARVMSAAVVLDGTPAAQVRRLRAWPMAAAAAVLLGAGLVGWSTHLQMQMGDLHDTNAQLRSGATAQANLFSTARTELVQASTTNSNLADAQDAVVELVAQPDLARIPMTGTSAAPGSTGRYIWSKTSEMGALVAKDMPQLPDGESYCMWIVYSNAWVSGGLFAVDATGTGHLVVRDTDGADGVDRGQFQGFAVTIEPSSGAAKHSDQTVLQSAPRS